MAGRQIVVSLISDSSKFANGFNDGLKQAETGMQKFTKNAKIASALVLGAFAAIGKQGIEIASDTAEATSKAQQVFGKSAKDIEDFAATSAKTFGISKREALGFTSAMGSVATAMGVPRKKAAELSLEYTKLSADLASFNNTSVGEAAEALKASVSGEYEQLKKFGIVVNDVTLAQEAQRQGMVMAGKTWSQDQKLKLSNAIITRAAKDATGDFARTSDGLANQQKILAARVEDLKGKIGAGLLPVMTQAVGIGLQMVDWIERNQKVVVPLVATIGGLAAAVWAINAAVKAYTAVQAACNAVMALNPAILIAVGIGVLIAAIVLVATKTQFFQKTWSAVWGSIKSIASSAFKFVTGLFLNWTGPGLLIKHFDKIKSAAQTLGNGIKSVFNGVKSVISGAVNAIKSAWNSTVGGKGIHIPSVGIGPFKTPGVDFSIPYLANGGTATGGMPHIVGERGPELFIPRQTGTVLSNRALAGAMAGGSSQPIVIHNITMLDGEVVANNTQKHLLKKKVNGTQIGLA